MAIQTDVYLAAKDLRRDAKTIMDISGRWRVDEAPSPEMFKALRECQDDLKRLHALIEGAKQ